MIAWGAYVSLPPGNYTFLTREGIASGRRLKMLAQGERFTVSVDGALIPVGSGFGMPVAKGATVVCVRSGDEYTSSVLEVVQ